MLNVVKIGGNIIDDESAMQQFLKQFAAICEDKILVHGGGKLATEISMKFGLQPQFVDGRRITDGAAIRIAAMTYAGWISKHIVASLQSMGCSAVGLSGADVNCIAAVRRQPVPIDYGLVGDVNENGVNVNFLQLMLNNSITPVLCAITHDGKGNLLNTNADSIASAVAGAMSKAHGVRLIFCFEKNGVLSNPNDENSTITELSPAQYDQLKTNGSISGGMIPKVDSAFAALRAGVGEVIIKHALHINEGGGTMIISNN